MTYEPDEPLTAIIPADLEKPDKLMYGLTGRQLAYLASSGALASGVYMTAGRSLPLPVTIALVLPILAIGFVFAVGQRSGMGLDRYAVTALRHATGRKLLVPATEPITGPPGWCRMRGCLPAPLRLPVLAVREDGVMELADGATAVLVKAATLAFGLRTPSEQAALVGGFGRWLNSLDASTPVQILVQARPIDLSGLVADLTQAAPGLCHPSVEAAALDHAGFLSALDASRSLLARQVFLILRAQAPGGGKGRAVRRQAAAAITTQRAKEAIGALAALGITARLLDRHEATAVLAEALSPGDIRPPGLTHDTDEPITGRKERA